jgi:16S rRNA (guanine527-N7)-methyltransferase
VGQFVDQQEPALLDAALDALGLAPPAAARERLLDFATELIGWGRRINLTGAADLAALVRGPLFDALTLLPALGAPGTLVDVGSGGGLPGIPLALLAPEWQVTLVEPRARRAAFLRHAVHVLELDVEVVQSRAEELKDGQWSAAVAQAVWSPNEWLAHGRRLVEPGGAIYLLGTRPVDRDWLAESEVVEEELDPVRPFDGARRFSARIRT